MKSGLGNRCPPRFSTSCIIQMGLAVCCLVLAIGALAFISFSVSVPFLLGRRAADHLCRAPVPHRDAGDSISFSAGLS